jgi:hypothetical protein
MPEDFEAITDEEEADESSSASTAGFVLTRGDIYIFKLIYDYRFLRTEHVSALSGRSAKRVHRRWAQTSLTVVPPNNGNPCFCSTMKSSCTYSVVTRLRKYENPDVQRVQVRV